jgi:hypothetical protein
MKFLNEVEDRVYFFIIIVMMICFDAFTKQNSMTDLAKLLIVAYASYMTGKIQTK